jgi:hypothetical protein
VLILTAVGLIRSDSPNAAESAQESQELETEGYVDLAGLIEALPQDLPDGILVEYRDEQQAKTALQEGQISATT